MSTPQPTPLASFVRINMEDGDYIETSIRGSKEEIKRNYFFSDGTGRRYGNTRFTNIEYLEDNTEKQNKTKNNTELLCLVLGWQGGTVHQVSDATGLTVQEIIDTEKKLDKVKGESTSGGWFAVKTCTLTFNQDVNFPKAKGNLAFWMGAARAMEFILK